MSSVGSAAGGGNEANDEGEEKDDNGRSGPVSESPEKGQGADTGRILRQQVFFYK
jgi:hypothetical protein